MAAEFDNATTSPATAGDADSFTHTPAGTPTEAFFHLSFEGITATFVAPPEYGGAAMSLVSFSRMTASSVGVYRLAAPPAGAQTVEYQLSASGLKRVAGVVTLTGTLAPTVFAGGGGNNNTARGIGPAHLFPANGIAIAFIAIDNAGTLTATPAADLGLTEVYDVAAGGSGNRPRIVAGWRPTAEQVGDTSLLRYATWNLSASRDWRAEMPAFSAIPVYVDGDAAFSAEGDFAADGELATVIDGDASFSAEASFDADGEIAVMVDGDASFSAVASFDAEGEVGQRAFINTLNRYVISQKTIRNRDRQIQWVARKV